MTVFLQALEGRDFPYVEGRFDSCLRNLHINKIEGGKAVGTLHVSDELLNAYGTMHGGAITTLTDVFGTLALLSVDHTRAGVSVEINTSFMGAVKRGEQLTIEGNVLKSGRTLGFTEVLIQTEREDGRVVEVAKGRHTKALL